MAWSFTSPTAAAIASFNTPPDRGSVGGAPSQGLGAKIPFGPSKRVLWVVAGCLGAYFSARLPVMIVVVLIAAVDAAVLSYWLYGRWRSNAPAGSRVPLTPMRHLADMISVTGILLVVSAGWLTILGFLTESGITDESSAQWNELAAVGFEVRPETPSLFGAQCAIVAAAVWAIGFGLSKASGRKA